MKEKSLYLPPVCNFFLIVHQHCVCASGSTVASENENFEVDLVEF